MVGGRWVLRAVASIAFWCASCAGNRECVLSPLPATVPHGFLEVRERNEFSEAFQLLSATYELDGCALETSPEPRVIDKDTMVVEPRAVSAGPHKLGYLVKFRDVLGVDFQMQDVSISGELAIDVPKGGTSTVTVRPFDDLRGDARGRARVMLAVGRSKHPPALPGRSLVAD